MTKIKLSIVKMKKTNFIFDKSFFNDQNHFINHKIEKKNKYFFFKITIDNIILA